MVIFDFNTTHAICRVNDAGSVFIPKAIRDRLGVTGGTQVELFYTGNDTYTMRFLLSNRCAVCGSKGELVHIKGKAVCKSCLAGALANSDADAGKED